MTYPRRHARPACDRGERGWQRPGVDHHQRDCGRRHVTNTSDPLTLSGGSITFTAAMITAGAFNGLTLHAGEETSGTITVTAK